MQLDENGDAVQREEAGLRERGLGGLTELQQVDICITRLWLRHWTWQIALSRGLLCSPSSPTAHEATSLQLLRDLTSLFDRLENVTTVGFHEFGIVQKLFEITSTIADVLALPIQTGQVQAENGSKIKNLAFLVDDLDVCTFVKEAQDWSKKALVVLNFTPQQNAWSLSAMHVSHVKEAMGEPKLTLTTYGTTDIHGDKLAPFEGRIYLST